MPFPKRVKEEPGEDIDLAVVLGGEGEGGEPKPKRPKPEMEPGGGDELPPGFMQAAEEALNVELPMEDRARALKAAIHLCYDEEV